MDVDTRLTPQVISQRHPSLYFPAGDVVLIAEKDKVQHVFRVHKSILSHHSSVFKDMFALPSGDSLNELYDTVPVVRMHDEVGHLDSLLHAFYDPTSLPMRRHDPDFPLEVRGILSLANKYQVELLRERIVRYLESEWPTSALEWVRQRETERSLQDATSSFFNNLSQPDEAGDYFLEPASAIRLAHDFNISSILPAAYLRLARADPTIDWDTEMQPPHARQVPRGARWKLLDSSDMLRLVQGKQMLQYTCIWILNNIIHEDADCYDGCLYTSRPRTCQQIVEQKSSEYRDSYMTFLGLVGGPDCIEMLIGFKEDVGRWKLCLACTRMIYSRTGKEIRKLWDCLPQIFRLVPQGEDD